MWEWCEDVAYTSARRFRGGDWYGSADYCSVADRGFFINPDLGNGYLGFRLARSLGN